jgi:hypothetical protein
MKRITRDRYGYAFDASLPPVIEVDPGEAFWVETNDAHRGTVTDEGAVYADLDDAVSRLGGANPVSGPVALRGAPTSGGDGRRIAPAPHRRQLHVHDRASSRRPPDSVLCPVDGGARTPDRGARAGARAPARTLGFAWVRPVPPSGGTGHPGNLDLRS